MREGNRGFAILVFLRRGGLRGCSYARLEQLDGPLPVSEVMQANPVTVTPETSTLEAIELMRRHKMSCLPVVKGSHLVGIVTESQFMAIAGRLLEENLRE